jgi:hypothetical protein
MIIRDVRSIVKWSPVLALYLLLGVAAKALASDFDLDGDVEIVAIGIDPGVLVLYGNGTSPWTKTVLAGSLSGGSALAIADVDGDGDQDIIAGAAFLGRLYWRENLTG